jgi:hypothetical protein
VENHRVINGQEDIFFFPEKNVGLVHFGLPESGDR